MDPCYVLFNDKLRNEIAIPLLGKNSGILYSLAKQ